MSRNKKNNSNKTKHALAENEFKKTFKKYLVFQLMYSYFKRIAGVGDDN